MNTDLSIQCHTCNDIGWVTLDVPVEDVRFGKTQLCPDCSSDTLQVLCWDQSGIPMRERNQTFDAFKDLPGTKAAYNAAIELANHKSGIQLVTLCGQTGAGKTHLGNAVAIKSINEGVAAWVIVCKVWLKRLKSAIGRDERNKTFESGTMREGIENIPVLILDELKWYSKFDEETMDDIVCNRLRSGLRTLITTNYNGSDINDQFPRIASRSSDDSVGRLIVLREATDYRKRKV